MKLTSLKIIAGIFIAAALVMQAASAQTSYFSYYGQDAGYYFPTYSVSEQSCESGQGQDFVVEIPPGECQPALVRSDLLEEQNVPVFCRMVGLKINPLIETPYIKSVTLGKDAADKGIVGITFHPYRAALKSSYTQLIGSPLSNELGYVVVVLKQTPAEKNMPAFVNANLTAVIKYDLTTSFGVGLNEILAQEIDDKQWSQRYQEFSFWQGKGFARAKNIKDNSATIELYLSSDKPFTSVDIQTGDNNAKLVYLPGSYCSAGANIKLNEVISPQIKANLLVDGNKVQAIRGTKLLEDCTVQNIISSAYSAGGTVEIKCPDKTYSLEKSPSKATLTVESKTGEYSVGTNLTTDYPLVFAGNVIVKASTGMTARKVVVIGKGVSTQEIYSANERLGKMFSEKGDILTDDNLGSNIQTALGSDKFQYTFSEKKFFAKINVKIESAEGLTETAYTGTVKTYYDGAISGYEDVAKNWPTATSADGSSLGEKALWEAAQKAENFKKDYDAARLWREFISTYPDSKFTNSARQRLSSLMGSSSVANAVINLKGTTHTIILDSISEPSIAELSVDAIVNGEAKNLGSREILGKNWQIDEIKQSQIIVKYIGSDQGVTDRTKTIDIDKTTAIDSSLTIKVTKINLEKEARITISPYSKEGITYANFSVHIGIEKRAIQLSPDQTKSLIGELDNTIKKWEDARDKLGKLVESWKKACFAGSAALWAKNFLSGLSGSSTAMARQNAMREFPVVGADGTVYSGFSKLCEDKKNWNGAVSVADCLYKNSDKINDVIDFNKDIISSVNTFVSACTSQSTISRGGIFKGSMINDSAMSECLGKEVVNYNNLGDFSKEVQISPDKSTTETVSSDLLNEKNIKTLQEKGQLGNTDSRDTLYLLEAKKKCEAEGKIDCAGIDEKIYDKLSSFKTTIDVSDKSKSAGDVYNKLLSSKIVAPIPYTKGGTDVAAPVLKKSDFSSDSQNTFGNKVSYLATLPVDVVDEKNNRVQGDFLFAVTQLSDKSYQTDSSNIFKVDDKGNVVKATDTEKKALSQIKTITPFQSCDNEPRDLTLKYWDSGQFKGMPAILPLGNAPDNSRGWYAAIKGYPDVIQAGVTSSKAYTDSGKPTHFYICNVGKNGLVNFADEPSGDDGCCQYFAIETYSGDTVLPGLSKIQTQAMVNKAVKCIESAASSYGNAKVGQTIDLGQCGSTTVGSAKALVPNVQCEDFMSPTECRIMYNLCDPVICPASRCNLGGSFTVSDVIQTGVIGSMVLCLPNIREGIVMPVCISGVYAGLDGYVSIMKAAQGCLNESLTTGKNVGICDQLSSIYMCEFFWSQVSPFLKTGLPELVESAVLGRRSGGEYLTFKSSWDNSIQSVQYFADYYGVNALNAFKVRTTQEAGTALCQAFVGLRYPDSASLFDELSKPESPIQINAWFDDIPFSSVVVPATSQYKVFWHIYAGNDQAVYFTVYLKNPSTLTVENIPPVYTISSGYIEKGNYDEASRDLVAPSGYQELCVRTNLKENCGFKKVSTGFLTNYLTDAYVSDQTTPTYSITSETECASGATSLMPSSALTLLTQPSAGGLTEAISPEIYKRGIVRICSQENPGKGVEEARWSRVGFCNSAKTISCWVDKNSVSAAITDLNITSQTIANIDDAQKAINEIIEKDFYMTEDQSIEELNRIKTDLIPDVNANILKITTASSDASIKTAISPAITPLNSLIEKSVSEKSKAEAQMLISEIYNKVADRLKPEIKVSATVSKTKVEETGGTSETTKPKETATGIILGPAYVSFDTGKSDLTDAQKNKLTKDLLAIPQSSGYTFVVTGFYADGEDESIALKRANAVYSYINSQNGVSLKNNGMGLSFESGGLNDKQVKIRGVACSVTSAAWSPAKSEASDMVELIAYGDKTNCEGIRVYFEIKKEGGWSGLVKDSDVKPNPESAVFSNGAAKTTWAAEYSSNNYLFYANINLMKQVKSDNQLVVSQKPVQNLPTIYVFSFPSKLPLSTVATWYGKREDEIAQLNGLPKIGAELQPNQKIDISLTLDEFNKLKAHQDLLIQKYTL